MGGEAAGTWVWWHRGIWARQRRGVWGCGCEHRLGWHDSGTGVHRCDMPGCSVHAAVRTVLRVAHGRLRASRAFLPVVSAEGLVRGANSTTFSLTDMSANIEGMVGSEVGLLKWWGS